MTQHLQRQMLSPSQLFRSNLPSARWARYVWSTETSIHSLSSACPAGRPHNLIPPPTNTSNIPITKIKPRLHRRRKEAVSFSLRRMRSKASFCHSAPEHQHANPSAPKDWNQNRQQDINGWSMERWFMKLNHEAQHELQQTRPATDANNHMLGVLQTRKQT